MPGSDATRGEKGSHTDQAVLEAEVQRGAHPRRIVAAKYALDGEHAAPQRAGVDVVDLGLSLRHRLI